VLSEYGISTVIGDAYAGETFKQDFRDLGINYTPAGIPKSELYEALEPLLNAGKSSFSMCRNCRNSF